MIKRSLLALVLLLMVLGIAAPYIQADGYGQQIRNALQRGLNRRVEMARSLQPVYGARLHDRERHHLR